MAETLKMMNENSGYSIAKPLSQLERDRFETMRTGFIKARYNK